MLLQFHKNNRSNRAGNYHKPLWKRQGAYLKYALQPRMCDYQELKRRTNQERKVHYLVAEKANLKQGMAASHIISVEQLGET